MIINRSGIAIRLALKTVRIQGRNTQGVTLINLKKRNDAISSVCKVEHEEVEGDDENAVPDADGQTNMTYKENPETEATDNENENQN